MTDRAGGHGYLFGDEAGHVDLGGAVVKAVRCVDRNGNWERRTRPRQMASAKKLWDTDSVRS